MSVFLDKLISFTLQKISAKYLSLNNHNLSVIFSSRNGDPPRVAGTTQSSDNCTNAFP